MPVEKLRIALLLPVGSEFSDRLAEGIVEASLRDERVVLVEIRYHDGARDPLQSRLPEVAGALVWLGSRDSWVERLLTAGVKVVNANSSWRGRIPYAVFDGAATARLAASHLFELGRSYAAFIGWATALDPRPETPATWFGGCCSDNGVTFHSHDIGNYPGMDDPLRPVPAAVLGRLRSFLRKLPKPAALWCEADHLARMVCDLAAADDLRVPQDLAVLGTGDLRVALMGEPPISTIPLPAQSVGREMLRLVVRLLEGEPSAIEPVLIPPQQIIVRASTTLPDAGLDSLYQYAQRWIHDHACEGVTVNELMETVPLSQRSFTQRFAELFGRTPGEEIRHVRMVQAQSYLRQTSLSIERIARLCGYDHPAKFTNFFKREAGVPPTAYRQANQPSQSGPES
jgi:LacI family transcriptional regulator